MLHCDRPFVGSVYDVILAFVRNVHNGSKADLIAPKSDVRFRLKSKLPSTTDHAIPRHFHLEEGKAYRFAARIHTGGGLAIVESLNLGDNLKGILSGAGIAPESVR